MSFRRGQAMLETALAVFFITVLFLVVFQVAHMVTTKILLDHAAARAARAKAVVAACGLRRANTTRHLSSRST